MSRTKPPMYGGKVIPKPFKELDKATQDRLRRELIEDINRGGRLLPPGERFQVVDLGDGTMKTVPLTDIN